MTQVMEQPAVSTSAPMIGGYTARKLGEGVRASDERMKHYRQNRLMFMRQFAGPYYDNTSVRASAREPINMIYSQVATILPHLVMVNPKAMVTSKLTPLEPVALAASSAWDWLADDIDLSQTLRAVVTDAMFGAGIVKVGAVPAVSDGSDVDAEAFMGYLIDAGSIFVDSVSLDMYVIDPLARVRHGARFEGNRFQITRAMALALGLWDRGMLEKLPAVQPSAIQERVAGMSETNRIGDDDGDVIELLDLWIPTGGDSSMVVTVSGEPDCTVGFLKEEPWDGPERGPYEMLGFHWLPDNAMPVPPVALLYDLHMLVNTTARKAGRQADRQKDLILFDQTAGPEAEKIRGASDGQMVGVQNVDRYKQVSMGGTNERGYEHLAWLQQLYSRIGGNLDLLSGNAAESGTLGQDEMLQRNASGRIRDMQLLVHQFVKLVGERMAWYLVHSQVKPIPIVMETEAGPVPATWPLPGSKFTWEDLRFDIEPYSMSPDDPETKHRRLMEWLTQVVLPTAQLAAAQGMALDVAKLAKVTGKSLHLEGMTDLYRQLPPMQVGGAQAGSPPGPGGAAGDNGRRAQPQRQETQPQKQGVP